MSRKFIIRILAMSIVLMAAFSARAQAPLLAEDFTYTSGAALTAVAWNAHSAGGTNTIVTGSPNLTFTGWPAGAATNSVGMTTSGEDDNRTFPVQTSGTVYAGVLVNLSDAAVDAANIGGYFFHLGPDPIGTTFRGRIYVKKDASNNLSFGITKASTSVVTDITYTPFTYSLNTTYLLIVKYTVVAGTGNDTVDLFINPVLGGAEPAPTVTAPDFIASDINPGSVALRQGTAATSPTVRVDAIRVATTWSGLTAAAVPAQRFVDFNGDGRTDYAVTRAAVLTRQNGTTPTQLTWYIYDGTLPEPAGWRFQDWGLSTDREVPADYDGDGKSDVAVWRGSSVPNNSFFFIYQSLTNTVRSDPFGTAGDDPTVTADYTGDGKADPATFRGGSQAYFYYRASNGPFNNQIVFEPWGTLGDTPAPADFDGDGRTDFAIRRNDGGGNGIWWIRTAAGAVSANYLGLIGDRIVYGDFDGDGRYDLAVVRDTGTIYQWFYRPSSAPAETFRFLGAFGLSGDSITAGDYDGDGRTDVSVWRASGETTTYFYVRRSSGGFFQEEWGRPGDRAVASWKVK